MPIFEGLVFEEVPAKNQHGSPMLDGAIYELQVHRAWLGHGWLYLTSRYGDGQWSQSCCFVPKITDEDLIKG